MDRELPCPPNHEVTNQETENKLPTLSQYFEGFVASPRIQKSAQQRLENAQKTNPSVTMEHAVRAELRTPHAKNALWDYRDEHPFNIDRLSLDIEFRKALNEYYDHMKSMQKLAASGFYDKNQDQFLDDEAMRSTYHLAAAQELVREKIVPNETLGRIIVQFVAIADGKDIVDRGRDERRINTLGY